MRSEGRILGLDSVFHKAIPYYMEQGISRDSGCPL